MFRLRSLLWVLVSGLVAILIGSAFFKSVLPGFVAPNFLIMLLVFLALREASCFGVFCAFLLGLEGDLCSGIMLGPWAGAYSLVYALVALAAQRIFAQSLLVVVGIVFAASLLSNLLYIFFVAFFIPIGFEKLPGLAAEAGLSAVLAPLFFAAAQRLTVRSDEERILGRSQIASG